MTPDEFKEWRQQSATKEWFALIAEMESNLREALANGAYTDLDNPASWQARVTYNQGQADVLALLPTLEPDLEDENESTTDQKLPPGTPRRG